MLDFRIEPFLYRFSAAEVGAERPRLLLLVSAKARAILNETKWQEAPLIGRCFQNNSDWFSVFDCDLSPGECFGFGSGLFRAGRLPVREWKDGLAFEIPIPVVERSGGVCRYCGGTGKREYSFDVSSLCLPCSGSGRSISYEHQTAFVLTATINVLLCALRSMPGSDYEWNGETPIQLLYVSTDVELDMGGMPLGGVYGEPLVRWLRRFPKETRIYSIEDAMIAVWKHMHKMRQNKGFYSFNFLTSAGHNGWLIVNCPGDACALHPAEKPREGKGYKFSCHNVDTAAQQLTLLTALGALTDAVVADGVGQ